MDDALPISSLIALPRINDVRFSVEGHHLLIQETIEGKGRLFWQKSAGKKTLISADLDVRGGVGYGGGDFAPGDYYAIVCARSVGLWQVQVRPSATAELITRGIDITASPCISPDGLCVIFIQSRDEKDELALAYIDGQKPQAAIRHGADFYMQPAWHPHGSLFTWVEWNHPHMPWDASRIHMAHLDTGAERAIPVRWSAGGIGSSASQPLFSPDGKWLSYLIRDGDGDCLMIKELATGHEKPLIPSNGFQLRLPEWVQGMRSYGWSRDSRQIFYLIYQRAETFLGKIDILTGVSKKLDISPFRWATQLDVSPVHDELAFIASAPHLPKRVCRIEKSALISEPLAIDEKISSLRTDPFHLDFPSVGGEKAYGLYYPPHGQNFAQVPVIVHIHSGPTGVADMGFNHEAVFFTSSGYGYAEVNYRGSTTYGYPYQVALRENWGVVDMQDTIGLAEELISRGWAHPERLVLIGSSAGGFTVLNTLIHYPGRFKGGICSYGVADLLSDAQTTHKFEKYYHRFLIGDLVAHRQRFINRSPIHRADKIKDPLLLFHGDQDSVVDIDQTRRIYQLLIRQGINCQMVIYEGEGHGFRQTENIRDYYRRIKEFLQEILK